MIRYTSEEEILEVVRSFEAATISRDAWRHAEHLTVAMHYLLHHDIDTATGKMRSGIFNLLKAFEVDLTKEMPYHETLTVFWMRSVKDFLDESTGSSLLDRANEMIAKFDKDYPMKFYTREFLFSDEARAKFLSPNEDITEN